MPQLPAHWLERCKSPAVNVRTNAGLALGLKRYETALRECDGRMQDIGNWLTLQGLVISPEQGQSEPTRDAQE